MPKMSRHIRKHVDILENIEVRWGKIMSGCSNLHHLITLFSMSWMYELALINRI